MDGEGSDNPILVDDGNFVETTGAGTIYDGHVSIPTRSPQLATSTPTFVSSDPSFAPVDSQGNVVAQTNANRKPVSIFVTLGSVTNPITINIGKQIGETSYTFDSFADGSYAKGCNDQILALIDGKNPATDKRLFSASDLNANTYTRNSNCWAASRVSQLTACSVRHHNGSYAYSSTGLIKVAPDICIGASHVISLAGALTNGTQVSWVTEDNVVHTRTITDSVEIASDNPSVGTDIRVFKLDSALPASIHTMKILPADWNDYIGTSPVNGEKNSQYGLYTLATNKDNEVVTQQLLWLKQYGGSPTMAFYLTSPTNDEILDFHVLASSGDSSRQVMIDDGIEVALAFTYYGSGSGPALLNYKTKIETAMTSLGSVHGLTIYNMSANWSKP